MKQVRRIKEKENQKNVQELLFYPNDSLENTEDLLFRDWLICGFWIRFRCWSKYGIYVHVNQRK